MDIYDFESVMNLRLPLVSCTDVQRLRAKVKSRKPRCCRPGQQLLSVCSFLTLSTPADLEHHPAESKSKSRYEQRLVYAMLSIARPVSTDTPSNPLLTAKPIAALEVL
jgi:hypothetical protein